MGSVINQPLPDTVRKDVDNHVIDLHKVLPAPEESIAGPSGQIITNPVRKTLNVLVSFDDPVDGFKKGSFGRRRKLSRKILVIEGDTPLGKSITDVFNVDLDDLLEKDGAVKGVILA